MDSMALISACLEGNESLALQLLRQGADAYYYAAQLDLDVLGAAAFSGSESLLQKILDRIAPELAQNSIHAAFGISLAEGHLPLAAVLLSNGAELRPIALDPIINKAQLKSIEFLIDHKILKREKKIQSSSAASQAPDHAPSAVKITSLTPQGDSSRSSSSVPPIIKRATVKDAFAYPDDSLLTQALEYSSLIQQEAIFMACLQAKPYLNTPSALKVSFNVAKNEWDQAAALMLVQGFEYKKASTSLLWDCAFAPVISAWQEQKTLSRTIKSKPDAQKIKRSVRL